MANGSGGEGAAKNLCPPRAKKFSFVTLPCRFLYKLTENFRLHGQKTRSDLLHG